jgi:HD-GYP domain-containing protein (c-di-GMP phosphodiesterase class II)
MFGLMQDALAGRTVQIDHTTARAIPFDRPAIVHPEIEQMIYDTNLPLHELAAVVPKRIEDLNISNTEMVMSRLVEVQGAYHPYHRDHALAVGEYAAKIMSDEQEPEIGEFREVLASHFGPEHVERAVRLAGWGHDIGKIATMPRTLADMTETRTPEQELIAHAHPEAGYLLLDSYKNHCQRIIDTYITENGSDDNNPNLIQARTTMELIHFIQVAALTHHRTKDGKGYPGPYDPESISMIAKVIQAADWLDAMNSYRIYRRDKIPGGQLHLPQEDIVNELDKNVKNNRADSNIIQIAKQVLYDHGESIRVAYHGESDSQIEAEEVEFEAVA